MAGWDVTETSGIESQQSYASKLGGVSHVVSNVVSLSDSNFDSAQKTYFSLRGLLDSLQQTPVANDEKDAVCRCGLVGRLQDTSDLQLRTMKLIEEFRAYLLG